MLTHAPAGWTLIDDQGAPTTGPAPCATRTFGRFVEATYSPEQGGLHVTVCTTTNREGLVSLMGHLQDALDAMDAARTSHGWH